MKIGIIRIDRMGDMILTLPIIKAIKLANPNTKIHLFASNSNLKIVENSKYVDKSFIFNKNINQYNNHKYDYILNFSPGWQSFLLCLFVKAYKKGALIFSSRYKKKFFSKLHIKILSKIFFNKILIINRIKRYRNDISFHQTDMMFELLDKCKIPYKKTNQIDEIIPKKSILKSSKKICLIHLTSRWINNHYTENDLINLISNLEQKYILALTTDGSTKEKFNLIFDKFPIINNKQFNSLDILEKTTIFDNVEFNNWIKIIYSSNLIITAECGIVHIASIYNIYCKIIYNATNKPNMMYREYAPRFDNHEKFVFNDKNLNSLLTQNLN